MLNIGDAVRVKRSLRRAVEKDDAGNFRRILPSDEIDIVGIYLGWTTRQEGVIQPSYEYGSYLDDEPKIQPAHLTNVTTHRVYVVQPLGYPADRWRKPVLSLPEYVEKIYA